MLFIAKQLKNQMTCKRISEVLLNRKLHIDRREAEVNMNCLLFNNTSCSPKQKSIIVLLYKKYIRSVIWLTRRQISVDVTSQNLRHYDITSHTMRHYLKRRHHPCDVRTLRHKPCDIKYCRPHVISLWTNEMAFIYKLYNNNGCSCNAYC